jgi:hypothetical protein
VPNQILARDGSSYSADLNAAAGAGSVTDWVEVWGVFTAAVFGAFNASIIIELSLDAGVTAIPVTQADGSTKYFTAPERIDIEEAETRGVLYRFRCTAYVSGTASCRFGR